MYKERTKEALILLENYFCSVAEQEAHGDVVPSRTKELFHAAKGLKAVAKCRYKYWLKEYHESMDTSSTTGTAATTMAMPMTATYK